jgi:hypothetical protein
LDLPGHFPAADLEDPHAGLVEEADEVTHPLQVGDGLAERHIGMQELRVDVGLAC